MKVRFILVGEGSSDLRLVEHIENLLIQEGFSEVSGETPDLGMFKTPVGRSVREKLVAILKYYPHADLIFVHRDADNVGVSVREQEISSAANGLIESDKVIPVVPVTMLETWLLADIEEVKRVAGNPSYRGSLDCVPPPRRLESVRDSKQLLLTALCEASETQGARLTKFKKRFSEMRARLTLGLDPEGPVRQLDSYQNFRRQITSFAQRNLFE
ncbi:MULTISPECIES: hypothetical protein [Pseudomonas]|uniref:DUF4276 family protein n=1 Tax=Pseudomonas gingeri TaxID=117681 RepID=A0A7Y7WKN3_9PSED|nr:MULTISPECIES: hypothetical protein [Pseudomonas]NWB51262.1 hypothetical protein [Pseudomonas gingeri]